MKPSLLHYYGDLVRKVFIASGVIMLFSLPFVLRKLEISIYLSLLSVVVIGLFAGITNPLKFWSNALNLTISVVGMIAFEYYAVRIYSDYGIWDLLFWINQLLAILFFFSFYFSTKTVRGMILS